MCLLNIQDGTPLDKDDGSDSDIDLSERHFEVGQWIDALDTTNKWLCAQIVEVRPKTIRVKFDQWSEKWNLDYDKSDMRLQPLGRNTPRHMWKLRGKKPRKEA